ncbi:MAG TPA: hypothetical protein VHL09_04825, partial [Dehalococcoidia bacterium]|nr:hypothetical protein [Dehalococcoidia bacterium]
MADWQSDVAAAPLATVAATRELIFYLNGEYVPESRATVSVMDHAVLYGDGVFDSLFVWEGRIHKVKEHLDRFYCGAQA